MIASENFIISERKRVLVLGSSYPFKWMFKEEANYIKTVGKWVAMPISFCESA